MRMGRQGRNTYMCSDVVSDEVFEKVGVVVGQEVLHHG